MDLDRTRELLGRCLEPARDNGAANTLTNKRAFGKYAGVRSAYLPSMREEAEFAELGRQGLVKFDVGYVVTEKGRKLLAVTTA